MNIDQLKAFYEVAQTGGFTRAAERLHVTQSAVSQQVRALEHSLGIVLFDRTGNRVSLTCDGETLLVYAKPLFDRYKEIVTLFKLQKTLKKGKIKIASTRVLGTYYLPKIIGLYNRKYPGIEIDLRLDNTQRILDIVLGGEVDFGFAGKMKNYPMLTDVFIHSEKLLIVASPHHYLAAKKTVAADELLKTPFIWREKGTQTQRVVRDWFERNMGGNCPPASIALENVEAAKNIVEEGYGVTSIPESAVKKELEAGTLKRIQLDGFELSVDFHLFYFKGKVFSKAAEAFLRMIADIRLLSHSENLKKGLR